MSGGPSRPEIQRAGAGAIVSAWFAGRRRASPPRPATPCTYRSWDGGFTRSRAFQRRRCAIVARWRLIACASGSAYYSRRHFSRSVAEPRRGRTCADQGRVGHVGGRSVDECQSGAHDGHWLVLLVISRPHRPSRLVRGCRVARGRADDGYEHLSIGFDPRRTLILGRQHALRVRLVSQHLRY